MKLGSRDPGGSAMKQWYPGTRLLDVTFVTLRCRSESQGQVRDHKGGSMGVSDSHHFRKLVAGCCMVAGPLFALAAFIFTPAFKTGSAAQVVEVSRHQDSFLIALVLSLIAVTFVVGATLGFMHM